MIREYLSKILSARYGRDVRQAIHDSIQQCYYDGKAGEIDLQARQDIETLNGEVESLKGADIAINENIQALGNAMDESFRALGNEVEGLKDADNTINQTLQELGDDVAGLKVSTNDIVETTETTMPNSCEGRLLFKEIRGKTEQGANPSPTNPQEIKSVSISGIKTHRNNLFDYSKAVNGYITNDGEFAYHPYVIISDYIPSNGNVTVSLNKSVIAIAINCFDSSNNFISKNIFENCSVATLDTVENCADVRIAFTVDDSDLDISRLLTYEPMVNEGDTALPYEPYNVVTFSSPIELNEIGDVQDVIVDGKPIRKITKKRITSDMAIVNNPEWANKQAFVIESFFSDGLQVYDAGFSTIANILCTHAATSSAEKIAAGSVMSGVAQNMYTNLFFSFENCTTLDELKTFLDNNVVDVYYELATPITSLPTADQVALNSIETFDGTTYLEFDSPLQPEFVAEYGTSKVGGVALEAKGESQANSENIEEMNSVLNGMNTILQGAFIPRNSSEFNADANLCTKSGVYSNGGDWVNVPYKNGFLIVFACDSYLLLQINASYSPQHIAIRANWYGTWYGWYRLATEAIT